MEIEKRRYLLNKENKKENSHLIILIDRSDYIPEEIIRYVKRNEDIKNVIFEYICNPNLEIWNIFNYDMDIEMQINEEKPYHIMTPYNKMNDAYIFAKQKHKGQIRKDGSPYINHPIKVAELIKKYFKNHKKINELITAAYLHDTLEDTNTSKKEIEEIFGEYVSHLVTGVTNEKQLKRKIGKTNYLCNKIITMDEDTLNLKLCDRLANILDLDKVPEDFKEKYEIETTILINYLLSNKKVTEIQKEIIKDINKKLINLRKQNILRLIKI